MEANISQPVSFTGAQASPELISFTNLATWQNLMPSIAALTATTFALVLVGWFFHLIEPGLRLSFSSTYAPYKWVKGQRGFGQFFKVAYDCVFGAEALFKLSYEKVTFITSVFTRHATTDTAFSFARLPMMYSSCPSHTYNQASYS